MDLSDKSVLVWDSGLFVHCAVNLAESFGTVWYGGNYVNAFPRSNTTLPGDGLDRVERVLDFWRYKDKADLIVFPDVLYADMQEECVAQGKRVYGARWGENLEIKRWETKQLLKRLGMPVAETHLIEGMTNLREFLQERSGKWWIKTSRYRGDFETFDVEDYDEVKPKLDELEHAMGRRALYYPFIVERDIPAVLEIGYDGDTVDGQFPGENDMAILGMERKDTGLVGVAKPYGELPTQLRWVNDRLRSWLRERQYRGWFSTEVRCQRVEDTPTDEPKPWRDASMIWNLGDACEGFYAWLTDPCCRMASPPSELYIEWIENWAEKVWQGAEGVYVPSEITKRYGVEIMLHSAWADRNWQPVTFPNEFARFIKLRNMCRIEGVYSAVPQGYGLPEIGAAIGMGDTLLGAAKEALLHAKSVGGYFIEPKVNAIEEAVEEIRAAQEAGMPFCDDPLPSAEEIVAANMETNE